MNAPAADKYREAIELYSTTDLTIGEISRRCGVGRSALAAYIQREHRDLMYRRHGVTPLQPAGEGGADGSEAVEARLRGRSGQSERTRDKYREAIEACRSEDYIQFNVSQIARKFGLDPTALSGQLRAHYPDIIPRREARRRELGVADNLPRGVRRYAVQEYVEALEMLEQTDLTIDEVAARCGVSPTGLRQHLVYYRRDILARRETRREQGRANPTIGALSGNGKIRLPSPRTVERYAPAVELYRNTDLPVEEIARRTGVNVSSLRRHLSMWHHQTMLTRNSNHISNKC